MVKALMAIYTKYLVCYDIEDNKTRKKLFDFLKDLGLISLQMSVFYGDLNSAELSAMKSKIRELLKDPSDKCLWFKSNLGTEEIKSCVGYSNFEYIKPDGHDTI